MAATWEVSGTTATYKNDAGKVVATIKGLKSGLKVSGGTITGITVTEGTDGGTGSIKLDSNVLTTTSVSLSLSNGGKYELGLNGYVQPVTPTDVVPTVKTGTLTLTGNLTEGYKLKDAKNITYSKPVTGAKLATVSNLNTALVVSDGQIGFNTTDATTGETTFTEAITYDEDGIITVVLQNALTTKNATLKNDKGSYEFALGNDVNSPSVGEGTWTFDTKKGTATYNCDVGTAGYTLSLDNKTINYMPNGDGLDIFKISGVAATAEEDDFEVEEIPDDTRHYAAKITLGTGALTNKKVTISGAGYQLVLGDDVQKTETTKDTWVVSNTTATYKTISPEYYTYDESTNSVAYTKQKDVKTLATVSNLAKDLTVGTDTDGTGKSALYADTDLALSVNSSGVVTVYEGALNEKNVTLKNGKNESYSLMLSGVDGPVTSGEVWSVSGTTATLKGNVTTKGYAKSNDTTITYVKESTNKLVNLATVKGLVKGIKANADGGAVGIGTGEDFVSGLTVTDGVITVSDNVLGTTNVTLTPTAGFSYSFALDEGTVNEGGAVPTHAIATTFWNVNGSSLVLKDGYANYYTKTDATTITQTDSVIGSEVATVTGLKTGLKVDSDYQIDGLVVSGKKITVSSAVLDKKDVKFSSNSGNYQFALNADERLDPHASTMWRVNGTNAVLQACISEGYDLDSSGKTLTYETINPKGILATITGLKSGLKVKDDYTIDGITADVYDSSDETAAKTITLNKKVLGSTDITLDEDGLSYGYSLALGDTDPIEVTRTWRVGTGKATGTAYFDVATTTAGFEEIPVGSEGETAVDNEESDAIYKLAYRKKGTVTTSISGLSENISDSDFTNPDENGVIKLSQDVLGGKNATLKNASGGTYTLALDDEVTAPVLGNDLVWVPDSKTKTKAALKGSVETAGYEVSGDALSVIYTPASTSGETDTLATVTGLKSGLTASGLADGITVNGNELVLTSSVVGGTKLTVTGGAYTLALGSGIHTSAEDTTGWVTSGTTATYKSYKSEYYTPDDKGTTVKFTKATAGTTYATVKGIAKDADLTGTLSGDTTGGTITLEAKHLGNSKVTLTGNNFKLALDGTVPTEAVTVEEWVTSGTTANFKNYTRAYYKKADDNTINYTAATKGTNRVTVSGIASGATITDVGKVITLNADQLAGKKVTLTGEEGYSLALGEDVTKAENGDIWWEQAKNATAATLKQAVSPGYTLATNKKSIGYSASETTPTIATVSGIPKNTSGEVISTKGEASPNVFGSDVITAKEDGTITLSEEAFGSSPKDKAKVTLKSSDYVFALGELTAPTEETPTWTVNKSKGTATYTEELGAGFTLTNDTTITYSTAKPTTLATISGLDKKKLAEIITEGNTAEDVSNEDLATDYGISVSGTKISFLNNKVLGTSKVTLGKKDSFEFDASAVAPTAGSNKWAVKGTTATYSATTTEGYNTTDTKTIAYVKEAVGDTIVQITGLKKGLGTDGTYVGVAYKDTEYDEATDTYKQVTKYSNSVILSKGLKAVDLNSEVLGTTDIQLTNGTGQDYTFGTIGIKAPGDPDYEWSYSGGTATYKKIQNLGYTKSSDGLKVAYTAAKTETLATVKGLNKNFTGNLDSAISTSGQNITLQSSLLTNSNVTLTIPKNGTNYSLKLADGVETKANATTEWVTSGTSATYKDYYQAYYTLDANSGTKITYTKPKDIKTYATIKGIKSGVDINSASAVSDGTVGGTVTLTAAMLGTSSVSVSVSKGNSATYLLAVAGDVPSAPADVTEWVTSKGTAVYRSYNKGSYAYNSEKNQIVYTAGTNPKGSITEHATIKGANGEVTAALNSDGKTFTVMGTELTNKVSVASTIDGEGSPDYAFSFNNDYNNSAITGSANADNIIVAGDRLTITGGKGDDTIDLGSGDRVGNVIAYSSGDGEDVIANFQSGDSITVKSLTPEVEFGTDIEITFGSKAGKITLADCDLTSITINGNTYSDSASDNLLADNNYSFNSAQLSEIVKPAEMQLTSYDFDSGLGLTKKDQFTAAITYAKNK